MKILQICILSLWVIGSASMGFGQYGLYGSPDTIKVGSQDADAVPPGGYATTSSGYATPPIYVAQQPVQNYPVQQSQPYGAQPTQSYMAQPTQSYATQPTQSYTPQRTQPYSAQPYTAQAAQSYATQPTRSYATPQTQPYIQQAQPAKSVTTYGQASSQYRTPAYTRPTYYSANQTGMNQPSAGQPIIPTPSAMPAPQMSSGDQSGYMTEPSLAPGIQQNTGVTNQMLAEQGQSSLDNAGAGGNCAPYGGSCGVYQPNLSTNQQPAYGDTCSEVSLWYGSISALVMTRDRPNKVFITYETGNLPHNDFPVDELSWSWGGEVRFGRRFASGCNTGCNTGFWALEASYWTLANFDGFVSHTSPVSPTNPDGTVGTPLVVGYNEFWDRSLLTYRDARDWFDGAGEHRLWRQDEIHNVEMNVVRGQWCYGQDSPWDLGFAMGVRYFRFSESWKFGSRMNGTDWDDEGGGDAAYLEDKITNDLVGPQLGFELGYNMCCNFRFYMSPKAGIYNNHMTNNFNAYLGNGEISRPTAASGVTGTYPVHSTRDAIAFLTQVDVGLDWQFARQWSAQFGYRVVTVSGIGLADAQIPFYIVDIPAIAEIDRNGDLILHGAFMTLSYNF